MLRKLCPCKMITGPEEVTTEPTPRGLKIETEIRTRTSSKVKITEVATTTVDPTVEKEDDL